MEADRFSALFAQATDNSSPLPYQSKIALSDDIAELIDVPTGLGKTAAAILGWIYRRRFEPLTRKRTPRRLIYCLPMRVLAEQTYVESLRWLERLGLLAGKAHWTVARDGGLPNSQSRLLRSGEDYGYQAIPSASASSDWASLNGDLGGHPIAVHLLMGGEEKSDWAIWPERDAILIGTQDMLISRALNRGYAAGRSRWPLEFAFLNSDCLWVFDEIQIMDTSLATSLQLDAWRRSLRLRPARGDFPTNLCGVARQRRCQSMWMSATMSKHWLERAVDWQPYVETGWEDRRRLSTDEQTDKSIRSGQLFAIEKVLETTTIDLKKPKTKDGRVVKADALQKQGTYLSSIADHMCGSVTSGTSGLTLVIMNTVDRATSLFQLLKSKSELGEISIKLMHSRFRPYEREQWSDFLNQRDNTQRILVATQVVEAGVDLSSAVLYTELAPWASLVQRFGRCARYPGETGKVFWLNLDLGTDKKPNEHWAKPYTRVELVSAKEKLSALNDVGLKSLSKIKNEIESDPTNEQAAKLFPYEPRFVPREKDLFDLFDTTPDLTGADVDISRYIRDGLELDVQVFWRTASEDDVDNKIRPDRRELCSVPFHRFREFAKQALKQRHQIWRRVYANGRTRKSSWTRLETRTVDENVYPGQVFLLQKSCGGYSTEFGWTGNSSDTNFDLPPSGKTTRSRAQDDEDDAEDQSIAKWQSIEQHTRDVCQKLEELLKQTEITGEDAKVLRLAARWHDRGKAHPAFTAKIKAVDLASSDVQERLQGELPAKAPDRSWRKDTPRRQADDISEKEMDRRRPGHRHELASALAILETLFRAEPRHPAFAWDQALAKEFGRELPEPDQAVANEPLVNELSELSANDFDLLLYLVAAHHGKVRVSMRSSPGDARDDVPDPCPSDLRQARGVRDGDTLPRCRIPSKELTAAGTTVPEVIISLDPMELGLSQRYGASWRERTQVLLERYGPFRLAYLEAILRAADCRASMGPEKEDD